jgi:hypothetical protein
MATGTGGMRGTGSPGAPQPAESKKMENRKQKIDKSGAGSLSVMALVAFRFCISNFRNQRM